MLTQQEQAGTKDALKWAARTYVVAALGSIATYIMFRLYGGSRRVEKKNTLKAIPNLNL
jgi:hypothetical protein